MPPKFAITRSRSRSSTRKTRSKGPASQVPDDLWFEPAPVGRKIQLSASSSDESTDNGNNCSQKSTDAANQKVILTDSTGDDGSAVATPVGPPMSQKHTIQSSADEDDDGSEPEVESAQGSEKYTNAMMGGKPLTIQDNIAALQDAGVKNEGQAEIACHNLMVAHGLEAPPPPVQHAPLMSPIPEDFEEDDFEPLMLAPSPTNDTAIVPYLSPWSPNQDEFGLTDFSQFNFDDVDALPTEDAITNQPAPGKIMTLAEIRDNIEAGDDYDMDAKQAESKTTRGCNEAKYESRKESLEKKFFDTIKEYGGTNLAYLLEIVPTVHSGGRRHDHQFYNLCGGEPHDDKKFILNKCLILCALKWTIKQGDKKGVPLQPNTFETYMKTLFMILRDKGIRYRFEKDFNGKGEFHGVVIQQVWEKARKNDPTFGCKPNEAQFMENADRKVVEAMMSGKISMENPTDLRNLAMFVAGRFWALRGVTEPHSMLLEDIFFGQYGEDDAVEVRGLRYIGVKIPWDKTHQLKFRSTVCRDQKKCILTLVENMTWGELCPYKVLETYLSHLHPDSKRFLNRPCDSPGRLAEYQKIHPDIDIWYYPSGSGAHANYNVGKNQIPKLHKDFAKACGAENYKHCTGQGLRKLCLTKAVDSNMHPIDIAAIARHSSLNSQKVYIKGAQKRKALTALALTSNLTGNEKAPTRYQKAKTIQNPYRKSSQGNSQATHGNSKMTANFKTNFKTEGAEQWAPSRGNSQRDDTQHDDDSMWKKRFEELERMIQNKAQPAPAFATLPTPALASYPPTYAAPTAPMYWQPQTQAYPPQWTVPMMQPQAIMQQATANMQQQYEMVPVHDTATGRIVSYVRQAVQAPQPEIYYDKFGNPRGIL
jgi:hypothetical protein